MKAPRGRAVAIGAAATVVTVILAAVGRAETTDPSKQTVTPAALNTTTPAARERPRGVVLDCSTQSGLGGGLREFRSRWNLVVGPLVMKGAARPGYDVDDLGSFGGNKFPVYLRGGHRVTVEVSRDARPGAGLVYGQLPTKRDGYRVVTFIACRRGELSGRFDGWPLSFWSGGVVARSPRCVPLLFWVDDEPSPRRAVIRLGVRACR